MECLSVTVSLHELRAVNASEPLLDVDLLVIMYPVFVFDAPVPIYKFLERLPEGKGKRVAVIPVSGGGEIFPNRACRHMVSKRLEQKGYKVDYEDMLIMPSNTIIPTGKNASLGLIKVLQAAGRTLSSHPDDTASKALTKCGEIASNLASGVQQRIPAPRADRLFARMSGFEKGPLGLRRFGERIKSSAACNSCGWCVDACPQKNISLREGACAPHFGPSCVLCLRCIYGCPEHALRPGFAAILVIKDGYSLEKMEKYSPLDKDKLAEELKSVAWSDVRRYLDDYLD
ncbi:MAG: EFR1 family ferrodoxin [Coriobacteriia bacterium]|nr:EFR1 family ferrodoxin [Coriobacteriia bacterium]